MSVVRVEERGNLDYDPVSSVGADLTWVWVNNLNEMTGEIESILAEISTHCISDWSDLLLSLTVLTGLTDWLLLLSWRSEAGQQLDMCQCDSAQLCRDQGWDTLSHSGAWSTLSPRHEWPGCGDQWHHDSELHQEEISTADQECSVIWSNLTCHSQHGRTETTQRK